MSEADFDPKLDPKLDPNFDPKGTARTGRHGELLALRAVEALGWQQWRCNVPLAAGEADLVCTRQRDGRRQVLLVEVKTTRGDDERGLGERLGAAQRGRLWRMAEELAVTLGASEIQVTVALVAIGSQRHSVTLSELEAF